MKRTLIIGVIVLLAGAGAASLYFLQPGSIEVATDTAKVQEVTRTISANGHFIAVDERTLRSSHNMQIADLAVTEGDRVDSGKLLARGETGDLEVERSSLEAEIAALQGSIQTLRTTVAAQTTSARSQIQAAQFQRDHAADDLESTEELFEVGAVSRTQLTEARAGLNSAEATLRSSEAALAEIISQEDTLEGERKRLASLRQRLARLEERLNEHEILSPGTFVVAEVFVEEGDLVGAGSPIALLQSAEVLVEAEVLAQDAASLATGQRVILTGDVLQESLDGTVSEIHPRAVERVSELGVTQQRVPVQATLPRIPENVAPGYPVDLEIVVAQTRALAAPRDAVFTMEGSHRVFRISEKRARLTEIEVGIEGDDYYEILSGLSDGDTVVVNPPRDLEDETMVR
ncbi:MAG: efflux RND transporter periplasmic adaptor subunit [Bacillota bacterium]